VTVSLSKVSKYTKAGKAYCFWVSLSLGVEDLFGMRVTINTLPHSERIISF